MWLVRDKDIVSYDKHRVADKAVSHLTHDFSFADQRLGRACSVVCIR
jgi:hypothetical protein